MLSFEDFFKPAYGILERYILSGISREDFCDKERL